MIPEDEPLDLPAFTALDSYTVLAGERRGTSVQLDETYFSGQLQAIETFCGDTAGSLCIEHGGRLQEIQESYDTFRDIAVEVEGCTEEGLWTASRQFRRALQGLPEIQYLKRQFPGQCFVVPEWLQTGDRLHYGARVYFFCQESTVTPDDVIGTNIDAILSGSGKKFERYQGKLHGYPDCCIDFYHDRSSQTRSPEWRSLEPFADRMNDGELEKGRSISIENTLPCFSEWADRFAFFSREFFPEPGCETALSKGRAIHDELSASYATDLIEAYFRLIFGYNYLVARAVHAGQSHRPRPGALGREHLMFYLPLRELVTKPRYP